MVEESNQNVILIQIHVDASSSQNSRYPSSIRIIRVRDIDIRLYTELPNMIKKRPESIVTFLL